MKIIRRPVRCKYSFLLPVFFILFLLNPHLLHAEDKKGPGTYAVIIGISDYANAGIGKLDYAHRDAQYFADYLQSPSGGAVPQDNIVLLQNESATYTAIYNALDWLVETCKEGDLVYFYFSGHGDMENTTMYKLGFLLSYNTPRTNYINNAVRIEDLNNYANTLSVKTKAKVILITDACHSGKITGGENKGSYLAGEQLRTVQNNEIRMASCGSDQVSVEDVKWGGGRGVFSYYLLNGLTGLADEKKDGKISVKEIAAYLKASMGNDMVLKARNQLQTAVINGPEDFPVSVIDDAALAKLKNNAGADVPLVMTLAPLPRDEASQLFDMLSRGKPEVFFDFNKLSTLAADEIPFAMIDTMAAGGYFRINKATITNQLKSNPDALKRFNRKLAEMISGRGQEIVNMYLNGDEGEMERRRYYNSIKNEYGQFAKMFEVALKLTDAKSPLAKILEIKYHYFSGVALRLKVPVAKNPAELIQQAFAAQQKARALEENAAYIHNELGVLYRLRNDLPNAEACFKKATDIVPGWAIPWSNLANISIDRKEYDKGLTYVAVADSLQKNYPGTYINEGMLYEHKNNLLLAEECLQKSISLNARFYLPYERLGYVHIRNTQYAVADSFFHEAEVRKMGYTVNILADGIGDGGDEPQDITEYKPCNLPAAVPANDVMTCFVRGLNLYNEQKVKAAEIAFGQVIAMDWKNPLAYHFLGRMMWEQKRWIEAELYLKNARRFYLDKNKFKTYCDSLMKFGGNKDNCITQNFRNSHYVKLADDFLLADTYEQWNHFGEAEEIYEKIIKTDSLYEGGYYKLWGLMEKQERYNDAEVVLHRYNDKLPKGLEQFNAFYRRVTERFPDSGDWLYRAGSFHYKEAMLNPGKYGEDMYEDMPDKELNPGYNALYMESDRNLNFDLTRRTQYIYGTGEAIEFGDMIQYPRFKCLGYLTRADTLLQDAGQRADINAKMGDMYIALNNNAKALPCYAMASSLQADNAGVRLKLVNTLDAGFHFSEAKRQLDTLMKRDEINYSKLLLLAKYNIHTGEFASADILLKKAKAINPLKAPEIADLNGRAQLMSKKYTDAEAYYTEYLRMSPGNAAVMYTLAKIYYSQGKTSECYDWLQKAISAGFNYYWVLLHDDTWNNERASARWKAVTAGIRPRPLR